MDQPIFDALSYTWGNPFRVYYSSHEPAAVAMRYGTQHLIICDGQILYVTRNLHDFLERWRTLASIEEGDQFLAEQGRKPKAEIYPGYKEVYRLAERRVQLGGCHLISLGAVAFVVYSLRNVVRVQFAGSPTCLYRQSGEIGENL